MPYIREDQLYNLMSGGREASRGDIQVLIDEIAELKLQNAFLLEQLKLRGPYRSYRAKIRREAKANRKVRPEAGW